MPEICDEMNGELIKRFDSLDIDRAEIHELLVRPTYKVVLVLTRIWESSDFANMYELQFNRALQSTLRIKGTPWAGMIQGHRAYTDSPYLRSSLDGTKIPEAKADTFYHFALQIDCGSTQGVLDIVAADFTCSIIRRLPRARIPNQT